MICPGNTKYGMPQHGQLEVQTRNKATLFGREELGGFARTLVALRLGGTENRLRT